MTNMGTFQIKADAPKKERCSPEILKELQIYCLSQGILKGEVSLYC
jgi:hypothetical protein